LIFLFLLTKFIVSSCHYLAFLQPAICGQRLHNVLCFTLYLKCSVVNDIGLYLMCFLPEFTQNIYIWI